MNSLRRVTYKEKKVVRSPKQDLVSFDDRVRIVNPTIGLDVTNTVISHQDSKDTLCLIDGSRKAADSINIMTPIRQLNELSFL